jgi:hypothetical protein
MVIAIVPEVFMKHWPYVEEQLKQAMAVLPEQMHPLVRNYLDNNELQLAWEAMEKLAEDHIVGSEAESCFWRPMAKAAGAMVEGHYESVNLPEGNAS